jgi:anti-anti-sigma regulatory factor
MGYSQRLCFVRPVPSVQRPADRSLRIAVNRFTDGEVRLQPSGYLDESTGGLLCAVVEAEARSGHGVIAIDLQHVTCLDESGLRALQRATRHVRAVGGRLTVSDTHGLLHSFVGISATHEEAR